MENNKAEKGIGNVNKRLAVLSEVVREALLRKSLWNKSVSEGIVEVGVGGTETHWRGLRGNWEERGIGESKSKDSSL